MWWRLYCGAGLIVTGLGGFYYAHYHRPGLDPMANEVLPSVTYNWIHVGAWALVILGCLTMTRGAMRGWRARARGGG